MFLKRLSLERVRCFSKLELDFEKVDDTASRKKSNNRKWTIVLGENGTGKSTILRAAALVTAGSSALADILGSPKDWIKRGAKSCRISAVIETAEGEERELSLELRDRDTIGAVLKRADESLSLLDDALEHTDRNYFVVGYGSSRRLNTGASFGRKGTGYRDVRANNIATLFNQEAELNPLESWAMQLDYERGKAGLKTVQSALSSFLPGLTFKQIDKRRKELLFQTPDGLVPLSQLSDGYQNVAAWVGDLLYRVHQTFDDYSAPLKTRGLLIIDEVDLHLHPKWQRLLHEFLQQKLPNMQLLVTTHSPVTAQQAQQHQLHFLKRRGRSVKLHCFDADPSNLLVSQLLMTEAFGLETDESKEIQDKKEKYRKLRDAKTLSAPQKTKLDALKKELGLRLDDRASGDRVTSTQRQLLEAVQAKVLREG